MASIHGIDIGDNAKFFYKVRIKGKGVVDLTAQYRNYGVTDDFRRAITISKDTTKFMHPLMVNSYDNNQWDSFFQPDSLGRTSLGEEGTSYWAISKTGWFADRREPGYPKGASAAQIVKVFDMHRNNMWKKFYDFHEQARWVNPTAPNDGSTSQIQAFGIPHYVVTSATAAVGQNGGAPSGYTTVSGLSRTTYPQLKNWTATATDMSINGGQKKMSQMIRKMRWVVPRSLPGEEAPSLDFEILSHETPYELYEDQKYAVRGDDNISKDPAQLRGSAKGDMNVLMFRGIPWRWVDALSNATTRDGTTNPAYNSSQPVYLLDHSTWVTYSAEGLFMNESEPRWSDDAHNVLKFHMDTVYQRVNINPGANGVITFA